MWGRDVQFHSTTKNAESYQIYNDTLTYLNMAFTTMFLVESILKILAFGLKVWMIFFYVEICCCLRNTRPPFQPVD